MESFPEDFELIGFFEAEPEITERDVPWFYNRLRFRTERESDRIVCEIEPGYGHIDLTWRRGDREIATFALRGISAVFVKGALGEEYLQAVFRSQDLLDFYLYLKPQVRVQWGNQQSM